MVPLHRLPDWRSVLAVVAHPDDESFGLGAVIDAFVARGTGVDVLCFTSGEASTLGAADDLATVRRKELNDAADVLGVLGVTLLDHADGRLAEVLPAALADQVATAAALASADGLLAFDANGVTGHPDHVAATAAAVLAGRQLGLDVLGWCLPADVAETLSDETGGRFAGRPLDDIDLRIPVDRTRQRLAATCHASQAVPASPLWRRLELQGPREHLRWLTRPSKGARPGRRSATLHP